MPIQQKHDERVIEKGCERPAPIQTYWQTGATLHANKVLGDNMGMGRFLWRMQHVVHGQYESLWSVVEGRPR